MLLGVVLPQMIRCGRSNCRCSKGQPHGPYFYRFWRECGKLRKSYVKRSELEQVQAQCEARRQTRCDLRAAMEAWRGLRAAVCEMENQA
jgi:hypothetical protein